MDALDEINKELEAKVKRLKEEIEEMIAYNSKLRSELEEIKMEEKMTLYWLEDVCKNGEM